MGITKLFAPLKRRIQLMLGRCVIMLIDDSKAVQILQIQLLSGELRDNIERFQEYGFTSVPHSGAEALAGFVGGLRAHGIVIAVDDRRYRLKALQKGEVALYDDQGQKIVLYRDRIEVEAPKVVVLSDDVHLGAEGGQKVARIGDKVDVTAGSSAGQWPIIEGSDKVSCA